eukprot:gnl/TRDRNA2_/TRDRNA2_181394_c0_seq1.p1 gnl/TRDRNA2_/TRDRNA2_181394_c0~~gnl/TRDRNA2_/TRDRNA2_181394_c0_seq1.p1  ORF type:complete len:199 (+),score=59.43 gnl/TRDRNA2_/TRDRNA2_181394_c0_seq1:71-667(+)
MAKPEELEKFLDKNDEKFVGFCCLQVLDQDGYAKKTKGSCIEAPLHLDRTGNVVTLRAEFPADPLFYLAVRNEENTYVFGQWWFGPGSWCRTNQICALVPKDSQAIHKALEQSDNHTFVADAEVPFLQQASSRLMKVSFVTKEVKFLTKVTSATLELPEEAWTEVKRYRSRLWQSWKVWSGKDEKEKEKKKDDKKDSA